MQIVELCLAIQSKLIGKTLLQYIECHEEVHIFVLNVTEPR